MNADGTHDDMHGDMGGDMGGDADATRGQPAHVAALREELVRAAVRRHRRRAARPKVAAACVLVVGLLVGGAMITRPAPALADVRVEERAGRTFVTLVELEHDPAEIQTTLRRAGLDVTVVAVPVGPSQVGRFVGDIASGALPSELETNDAGRSTFAGFSLPAHWKGALHLRVGRPAIGDEPYATFADALAPGEPLACRNVVGRSLDEVAAHPSNRPLELFAVAPGGPAGAEPVKALVGTARGRWVVVAADATSRRRVVLRISPDATAPAPRPPC